MDNQIKLEYGEEMAMRGAGGGGGSNNNPTMLPQLAATPSMTAHDMLQLFANHSSQASNTPINTTPSHVNDHNNLILQQQLSQLPQQNQLHANQPRYTMQTPVQNQLSTQSIFAPAMTHPVARASPTTIRWLLEHFEPAAGVSLPRATMYQHYCLHCEDNKIDPVNAASFGKLVRSVFVGLRTRRLGTRGNSKYHYYGIRMKLDSPLQGVVLPEMPASGPMRQSAITQKNTPIYVMQGHTQSASKECSSTNSPTDMNVLSSPDDVSLDNGLNDQSPEGSIVPTIPALPDNPEIELKFKSYAQEFLESIVQLKFTELHDIMMSFYANHMVLSDSPELLDWLARAEYSLYQTIISVLFPSVVSPMPGSMNDTLRAFAKTIQETITNVLEQLATPIDETLKSDILDRISSFSQMIRRITLLNHLSLSIHTIFKAGEEQRLAVVQDLNKITILKICQDSWIQDHQLISDISQTWDELKQAMEKSNAHASVIIQTWKKSAETIYEKHRYKKQFIMTWNFISSMVVRDLTLRSVTSFGSILVLRLFLDELVQYVVLEYEAKASDNHLIAIKL